MEFTLIQRTPGGGLDQATAKTYAAARAQLDEWEHRAPVALVGKAAKPAGKVGAKAPAKAAKRKH